MIASFSSRSLTAYLVLALMLILSACATPHSSGGGGVSNPSYKIGKPYKIKGRWYHPAEDPSYNKVGIASWYGRDFHGRKTANGEIYDMNQLTAAHTTLPLPSVVEVKNLSNGRKIVVRVNDRGPFAHDRIIDLSRAAARKLGFEKKGVTKVRVRYLGRAPLSGGIGRAAPSRAQQRPRNRPQSRPPSSPPPAGSGAMAPAPGARVEVITPAPMEPIRRSEPLSMEPVDSQADHDANYDKRFDDPDQLEEILQEIEKEPALTSGAEEIALSEAKTPTQSAPDRGSLTVGKPKAIDLSEGDPALYAIRVAALSSLANIDALRTSLEPIGPLRVTRVEKDNGTVFYRINMGPYGLAKDADRALEAVREAGYSDASLVIITP